jgi:putative Ca2+/H+ antiporter (TMEM165/GDT1 family)
MVSTFTVIFVAELPDKTALATLLLATRHPARRVMLGAGLAFLVQTVVAVAAGRVLQYLPAWPVQIASGLGFLVFAVLAIRRKDEEEAPVPAGTSSRPAWVTSFLVIFAAEWGDLTQLATAALVARGGDPWSVGIGALAALWAVTLLAAGSGRQIARRVPARLLNLAGGILFAVIGTYILASALVARF